MVSTVSVSADPIARAVDYVFWLEPGHASEPGVWYAGTSPEGLFLSEDGGDSWAPVSGFNGPPEQCCMRTAGDQRHA